MSDMMALLREARDELDATLDIQASPDLKRLVERIDAALAVTDGWQLVPKKPTLSIVNAMRKSFGLLNTWEQVWIDTLTAATKQEGKP